MLVNYEPVLQRDVEAINVQIKCTKNGMPPRLRCIRGCCFWGLHYALDSVINEERQVLIPL